MIPEMTFDIMVMMAVGILIYSLYDNKNHLYANIVLAALDGILFSYLGTAASVGAVSFTAASLGTILELLSWISFGYCVLMSYDVISEIMAPPQQVEDPYTGTYSPEEKNG
jgi:hypothetical protein